MKVIDFLKVALLGQKFSINDCTMEKISDYTENGDQNYKNVMNLYSEVSAIAANDDTIILVLDTSAIIKNYHY